MDRVNQLVNIANENKWEIMWFMFLLYLKWRVSGKIFFFDSTEEKML